MLPTHAMPPSPGRSQAHIGGLPTQLLARHERLDEDLAFRHEVLDIALDDEHGRSARIRLDISELSYNRTYSRNSLSLAVGERARQRGVEEIALQAQQVRDERSLTATNAEITIEGDVDLLLEHFSIASTAQRIMDFARTLSERNPTDSTALTERQREIADGIRNGMQQAEALLGGLPDLSRSTVSVVERMLDAWLNGAAADELHVSRFLPTDGDQPTA